MKTIHAPDLHIADARTKPEWHRRGIESLTFLAETIEREQPKVLFIPGDFWDAGMQNSAAAGFPTVLSLIQRILDVCPIAAVSGTPSHDPPGAYAPLTRLRGKDDHNFIMIQPGRAYFFDTFNDCIHEGFIEGQTQLLILGTQEITREWILANNEAASAGGIADALKIGVRSILLGIGALRAEHPDLACVFLFHGPIEGTSMQNGQNIGAGSITIGKEDLRLVASDITAWYGGNSYPKDYGELGQVGFNIVDLQPGDTFGSLGDIHLAQEVVKGRELAITRIDYPHPRRVKFSLPWPEPAGDVEGVQAWICYRATKEEAAKIDVESYLNSYLLAGALPGSRVTVELIPTETVRAAEITEKHRLCEKVEVYDLASSGFYLHNPIDATQEHAESIAAKCEQLELEAAERGAASGMHFRLRRLRLRGAVGIWKGLRQDEIDVDLDKYDPGLIALIGVNGAGKSTLIENMHPYPCMLTRDGKLQDHFRLRDSARELWFVDERTGAEYRALMEIDGANATGAVKYHLFRAGEPLTNGRKEDYEQAIEGMIGTLPLFLRSAFVSQRPTKSNPDLSDASKGERKAIFRELAGLDYIQAYSESAKARAGALEGKITVGRGQVEVIERIVAEEPEVLEAILAADRSAEVANTKIEDLTGQGKALREKVETLATAVAEQDAIEKSIREADTVRGTKGYQVGVAQEKINGYQDALGKRDLAQKNLDSHAKLKEQEAAENERLSGINKERAQISLDIANTVATHRDHAAKLQATKAKASTDIATEQGKRNVLKAKIDSAEFDLAGEIKACPKCGYVDPAIEDARAKKRELVTGWKEEISGLDSNLIGLTRQLKEAEANIIALIEPTKPPLPEADETELARIREALGQIDITTARSTTETAAKAEQEIATLKAQIATLEADSASLNEKAEQLRAKLDATIKPAHDEAVKQYEAARTAYTTAKEERATAAANLEAAQKQLAQIEKQKAELDELRTSLASMAAEAAEWRYLEQACGTDGIQALELDALAPSITAVANRLLSSAYGSRFSIEIRTTRLAGKGSKTKSVEDFAIIVIDNELLTEQPIETLSGGERVWVYRALYDAFAVVRDKTTGIRFLTVFADEADGALDPESRQHYFAMLEAAHQESGRRHTIVVTHSPEAQEAIPQKIVLERAVA